MSAVVRASFALLCVILLGAACADTAEAQRRRRRRRPPPAAPANESPAPDPASPAPAAPAETVAGAEPATSPEPPTAPDPRFDPGPPPPDTSAPRQEYEALMDELVQARMRVHALGAELFRTRIAIRLRDRTGDGFTPARLVVHLDGAPVFQGDGVVAGLREGREVFTGAMAPGPHVLTLEVEERARGDDEYRYSLRQSFRFQVARERLSEVTLVLEGDSDMDRALTATGEGRYEVRTRMRVAHRALPSGE